MTMSKISGGSCNRRAALRSIALGAAAIAVPSTVRAAGYRSANDRPVFATIGLRNQGITITSKSLQFADFAALADVDSNVLEANLQGVEKAQKKRPDGYSDYRKILDRKDIDAVMIATPDHWHTKISVEAMLAGKDVYCEKPLTLTVAEGKLIEKIVKQTGRVFQVGTMQRTESDQRFLQAVALVKHGRIGTVKRITCGINGMEPSPVIPEAPVPAGLDWDFWLGPAAQVPYRALPELRQGYGGGVPLFSNCHYSFRNWHEYSGGKLTDWGAHHVDIACWAIGTASATLPARPAAQSTRAAFRATTSRWAALPWPRNTASRIWRAGGRPGAQVTFNSHSDHLIGLGSAVPGRRLRLDLRGWDLRHGGAPSRARSSGPCTTRSPASRRSWPGRDCVQPPAVRPAMLPVPAKSSGLLGGDDLKSPDREFKSHLAKQAGQRAARNSQEAITWRGPGCVNEET